MSLRGSNSDRSSLPVQRVDCFVAQSAARNDMIWDVLMTLSIIFLLNRVRLCRQDPPNKKAREVSSGCLLRAIKTNSQKYNGRECTTDLDDGR
ncbi:MAG: hypothetical protein DPW18_14650 [Chloroflexi bacterium]|nr:hypothetical protein [Chloroflexota bacterium]